MADETNKDIVIPEARLRYTSRLFTPNRYQNDPNNALTFSALALIEKGSHSEQVVWGQYKAVCQGFFGAAELPYGKTPCIVDGALKFPDEPEFHQYWCLSCNRKADDGAPQVLLNPETPVVDRGEIYPGVFVAIHGHMYAYKGGRGGINFELHGIMKIRDGERLSDSATPQSATAFKSAGVQGATGTMQPHTDSDKPLTFT